GARAGAVARRATSASRGDLARGHRSRCAARAERGYAGAERDHARGGALGGGAGGRRPGGLAGIRPPRARRARPSTGSGGSGRWGSRLGEELAGREHAALVEEAEARPLGVVVRDARPVLEETGELVAAGAVHQPFADLREHLASMLGGEV